jgi:hypothetical protein
VEQSEIFMLTKVLEAKIADREPPGDRRDRYLSVREEQVFQLSASRTRRGAGSREDPRVDLILIGTCGRYEEG